MKVLVCGDRNWSNKDTIRKYLASVPNLELVIEGGARGADQLSKQVALEMNIPVREYPADWQRYGKAAGPIRNRQMLDVKPDLVIAFHPAIELSKGTKDCVTEARHRGISVRVVPA